MSIWDYAKIAVNPIAAVSTIGGSKILGGGDGISGITDSLGLTDTGKTDRAIEAQSRAAREAIELQKMMYGESKDRMQPYLEGGAQGFQDLIDFNKNYQDFQMGDFQADPGYQFRMDEGLKAIDRSAASRGRLGSGATMKNLQKYGQDMASQEYGNAYSRNMGENQLNFQNKLNMLQQLANYGANANAVLAGQGQNYAQNVGNTQTQLGNAIAAGEMGRNDETKGLWQQGANLFGMLV